ncbi:ABC transporter permease [Mesorhizobium sp. M0622]|uniref:ABC transporter permease n=1 Tax=unclassified Mesorhizobium TaxID=325217 RepID=UPI00333A7FAA
MKRLLKIYMDKPELVALWVLIVLVAYFAVATHGLFLNPQNLRGIMSLFPELAILALGFGLLMIAGEFDLSIGSMFGLAPMILCSLATAGWPFWPAFVAALLCCCMVGVLNGVITIRFGIPSFITTLGMLFMLRSLAVVLYARGAAPSLPDGAPVWAFSAPLGIIRVSVVWMIVLGLLVYLLLERTNFGNWVRATGGSLESAKAMGIPTALVKTVCFVICSLFAGIAGIIQVVRIASPLPSLGEAMELQAIAAAVIGGIALAGGVGNVLGVIVGMAIIRVIDAGMIMSRVDASWFKFAIGLLIILAVIANAWLGRTARRIKVETAR